MATALASLELDGHMRSVCVGCSEILYEQGMLTLVMEAPLPTIGDGEPGIHVVYRIAPGFTLDECRQAISARHIGQPWGS
jgi:hypothetical protein